MTSLQESIKCSSVIKIPCIPDRSSGLAVTLDDRNLHFDLTLLLVHNLLSNNPSQSQYLSTALNIYEYCDAQFPQQISPWLTRKHVIHISNGVTQELANAIKSKKKKFQSRLFPFDNIWSNSHAGIIGGIYETDWKMASHEGTNRPSLHLDNKNKQTAIAGELSVAKYEYYKYEQHKPYQRYP